MTDQTTTPQPDDLLADLIARCPIHGHATETWPECRCDAARKAVALMAPTNPGTDPCSEPPCQDTEMCVRHEMAAEAAEATQRTTGAASDQDTRPASESTARAAARRQLVSLGLAEWQAVALLLPVIAETYREVAEDAQEGAHGGTWGDTVPEAMTAFAAAYRKVAADCDLPGAPLPEATRALERERAEHDGHRSAVCNALGRHTGLDWAHVIERVETATAAAQERADLLTDARDALEAAGQNAAHGDDWPAVAPAIRALAAELERARRGETEAVRAREAADRRNASQMAAIHEHAERADAAEAALTRVRAVAGWAANGWSGLSPQKVLAALDGGSKQTAPAPCCVCGDPIQLQDDNDPTSWIHSPGSNTPCLDARPAEPTVTVTLPASLARTLRAALPDGEA